jgi:hypothetical protein
LTSNNNTTTAGEAAEELAARPNGKKIAKQQADTDVKLFLYELAREKIRQKGGLLNTRQALREIQNDKGFLDAKIIEHLEKHDPGAGKRFKENPEQFLRGLNEEIAWFEDPNSP